MKKRNPAFICSLACLVLASAAARPGASVCGTERGSVREAIYLHRSSERQRQAALLGQRAAVGVERAAWQKDFGEIAVLDDAGGVMARRNPFNLEGKALRFAPLKAGPSGYRFLVEEARWNAAAADEGKPLAGIEDDDSRLVDLPFEFEYYGVRHSSMFVHSDGNVSFEQPDAASAARSLGRLAAGPPRIGTLFSDLDPSQSGAAVRVWNGDGRVVVTWLNVPEYRDSGTGPRQDVQLELSSDGGMLFTYQRVTAGDVVVGISPGRLAGEAAILSFRDGSESEFAATVAERFGTTDGLDLVRAAQRFYESHDDSYDYLVFFNTMGLAAAPGALATETTVRSTRTGIGETPIDAAGSYGSPQRLQAVLNMGPLAQYPRNPYAPVGNRGLVTGDNTMTILGHEAGHLFLALASIRDPSGARPMLGAQNAHWSFNFNSEASLLEGNRIQDNGPGLTNRFLTVATVEGYSPLDQYLMGLRAPQEVPPSFLVRGSPYPNAGFPRAGVVFSGQRQDITVDDVIAAEGRRTPDDTVAQRRFRFALIMLVPAGTEPQADDLEKLESYRAEFERFFPRAAQERAWAECTLRNSLALSAWPAGGVVAGDEALLELRAPRPAAADTGVMLWCPQGLIEYPAAVTLPAGKSAVSFRVKGISAGTCDLVAESVDARYAAVFARIAVKGQRSDLRLLEYYSQGSLLVLRVTDANEVGYSNVKLTVEGAEVEVRTDAAGLAWIQRDPAKDVIVEVDGAPGTRLVAKARQ
ncbi:MAG: hypothetical protein HY858_17300 [Candidatus Solibacter usitatus]|nr:hypothetical protein [Candidatus Solibacter usitatus]